MKVIVTLELKTHEVNQLFKRRINGERLFINAVLHKFNRITGLCQKQTQGTQETYQLIEKSMLSLTQQFSDETSRFKETLGKQKGLGDKKITITSTFHPKIAVENPLAVHLIEFIEAYDNLVAKLKLLHLAGCFRSKQDYYANITRIQKLSNRMLSKIIA
ncbi:MAG: hypothetical protein K0U37_09465 [Gammaproteobacteria bacterium]|nr:hypothetical protein [Gammaproteobacteria bacterium]